MNAKPTVAPGYPDPSFGTDGAIVFEQRGTANAITSDSDGNLICLLGLADEYWLCRYLVDGAKDEQFNEQSWVFEGGSKARPTRVLLQEDGKILVIGESSNTKAFRPALMRFYTDGSQDLVFGRRLIIGPPYAADPRPHYKYVDGCLQKDQKILVCTAYTTDTGLSSRLVRLKTNGEPDLSFGQEEGFIEINFHDRRSVARDVQVQSDGKIIVAGYSWHDGQRTRTVARYTVNGQLDLTFGDKGYKDVALIDETSEQSLPKDRVHSDIVSRVAIQPDNSILIAGYSTGPDGMQRGLLVRLTANGEIDASFNGGEPLLISRSLNDVTLSSIAIQPDASIVVVGRATKANVTMRFYERVTQRGQVEGLWRGDEVGDVADVTVQPNGRIVAAGSSGPSIQNPSPRIWGHLGG